MPSLFRLNLSLRKMFKPMTVELVLDGDTERLFPEVRVCIFLQVLKFIEQKYSVTNRWSLAGVRRGHKPEYYKT